MRTYEIDEFKYMLKRGDSLFFRYNIVDDDKLGEEFRMYRSVRGFKDRYDLRRMATFKDGVDVTIEEPEYSIPKINVYNYLYNALEYYYVDNVDVFESKKEMERYIALDRVVGY